MAHDPPGGWTDELATGVAEIDAQHRELLENVALLQAAARDGNLLRAFDTLAYLERYASEHFASEERRMSASGYGRLAEHRALHVAFVGELLRRKAEYLATGSLASLLVELADWLARWLEEHVRGADREMARHLRGAAGP